jgi:hypothetical protein
MKTLALVITIAGVLSSVDAIKCYQCINTNVQSDSEKTVELLERFLAGFDTCNADKLMTCGFLFDSCGATTVTYEMDFGSFSVTAGMTAKSCNSPWIDTVKTCDEVENYMKSVLTLDDLTCEYKTCTSDACN